MIEGDRQDTLEIGNCSSLERFELPSVHGFGVRLETGLNLA